MTSDGIRAATEAVAKAIAENPEKARVKNASATATLRDKLNVRVTGPRGETVETDMPPAMGGAAAGPNPGWLLRAGLASCHATVIAMRAAQLGIALSRLEVTVESESDNRGMLGLDEKVSAGLSALRTHVSIAGNAGPDQLRDIVRWTDWHSPVACTLREAPAASSMSPSRPDVAALRQAGAEEGAAVAANAPMKSIPVDCQTRYYDEEGEGPPVILIHGSMSSSRQWRSLTDKLRGRFRVISPDLLACEQKDGALALGAFTFAQDCGFIGELIGINPGAHLLGHSYGGVVAIKAALARQSELASLILIEPSCFHLLEQEKQPEYAEIVGIRDAQHAQEKRGDVARAVRGFIEYWIGPEAWIAMPERRKELMTLGVPKLNEDWPGTLDHNTTLADYRKLALPILLIRAKDTRRPSYKIVDLIRAELPNATLAEVSSGGHMSPLTNPEPVNDAVERFLTSRPSATP